MWREWPPTVELPFKLQWASRAIGEQEHVAPTEIKFSFTPSKSTSALRVPSHVESPPIQFLVDSWADISIIQFDVIPDPLRTLICYSWI